MVGKLRGWAGGGRARAKTTSTRNSPVCSLVAYQMPIARQWLSGRGTGCRRGRRQWRACELAPPGCRRGQRPFRGARPRSAFSGPAPPAAFSGRAPPFLAAFSGRAPPFLAAFSGRAISGRAFSGRAFLDRSTVHSTPTKGERNPYGAGAAAPAPAARARCPFWNDVITVIMDPLLFQSWIHYYTLITRSTMGRSLLHVNEPPTRRWNQRSACNLVVDSELLFHVLAWACCPDHGGDSKFRGSCKMAYIHKYKLPVPHWLYPINLSWFLDIQKYPAWSSKIQGKWS